MTVALARRLTRLELTPASGRMIYRVFSTTEPALGTVMVRIITGVPRNTGRP